MAYSTSNPPALEAQAITGPKQWVYHSTEGATLVVATDYFSDGQSLGMSLGDVVRVVETDNSYALSIGRVTALSTSGTGATITIGSLTST